MDAWHNPHGKYAPVGYAYRAEQYCLDCIAKRGLAFTGEPRLICCVECLLNSWAELAGVADRFDERTYDSEEFPKSIGYHDPCQESCASVGCEDADGCDGGHHDRCGDCGKDLCGGE